MPNKIVNNPIKIEICVAVNGLVTRKYDVTDGMHYKLVDWLETEVMKRRRQAGLLQLTKSTRDHTS